MTLIHPTAIIDKGAQIGSDVHIGPHAVIEADVVVGERTRIGPGAFIGRLSTIGPDNRIGMSVQIGGDPQILDWKPVDSRVVIGSGNTIREFASIHRAELAGDVTIIGSNCFIMGSAHIAHDCRIGNQVAICNGALLAGHVSVGDCAFISGNCTVHQFVRIGHQAIIRGLTAVGKDVVPFIVIDQTNTVRGLNTVGMKRANLSPEVHDQIKKAYREIFRTSRPVTESLTLLEQWSLCEEVREMIEFIRMSERGICLAHATAMRGRGTTLSTTNRN